MSLRSLALHLFEQKLFEVPSFITRRMPVPRWTSFPQKWHRLGVYNSMAHLPYLASLALGVSQEKDVRDPDGAFHVPSENATLLFAFQDLHPDLGYLSSDARPADYLHDLRWGD